MNTLSTPEALFAMYRWPQAFAEFRGSIDEFYQKRTPAEKRYCLDAVSAITRAARLETVSR